MAPVPVRGTRNSSKNLEFICRRAAELMHITIEEAASLTMENGKKFFGILL